jgi:predicted nucleic acid-binding protein
VKIAADANALLSAVIGGRARLVLDHPEIDEVVTTEATLVEVREYAIQLGRKKKLAPDMMLLTVAALPVSIISPEVYQGAMAEARRLIGWRDPDDVEILAMTLQLKIPLWSNDNDFEGCGIERFTTAEILRKLGIFEARK